METIFHFYSRRFETAYRSTYLNQFCSWQRQIDREFRKELDENEIDDTSSGAQ